MPVRTSLDENGRKGIDLSIIEGTPSFEENNEGYSQTPQLKRLIANRGYHDLLNAAIKNKKRVPLDEVPQILLAEQAINENDLYVDDNVINMPTLHEEESLTPPESREDPALYYCVLNGVARFCTECNCCNANVKLAEPIDDGEVNLKLRIRHHTTGRGRA